MQQQNVYNSNTLQYICEVEGKKLKHKIVWQTAKVVSNELEQIELFSKCMTQTYYI